jgi:hypothetical protein
MQEMLQRFMEGADWMDAPVESAHLFHKRFKEYMRQYIKHDTGRPGLLGRVLQYVVRFEVQGRGSRKCVLAGSSWWGVTVSAQLKGRRALG